jgi:YihY family inner membrane protein
VERVDRLQQRHRWLAFPVAVAHRYSRQRSAAFAAMIAYYGFLSMFPLFLVAVSLTKLLLQGSPSLQASMIDALVDRFGVLGEELAGSIEPTTGDTVTVVLGLLVALWAGLGVLQSLQQAFNAIWDVPREEQPTFVRSRVRSLLMLVAFGVVVLVSVLLPTILALVGLPERTLIVGIVATYAFTVILYLLAYRTLTSVSLRWTDVLPGAALAAVVWVGLQTVGAVLLDRWIGDASALYGSFGVALGMLVWISLIAQVTLFGAQLNVVRTRRLWPRSVLDHRRTDASG